MRSRSLARALAHAAVAFMFISLVRVVPARACSICQAGDPLFSSTGASAQEQGTVSAYAEVMGWRKTSGLLREAAGEEHEPGREVNESQQLTLFLGWTPLDRLTLTLAAPFRFNQIREEPEGEPREGSHLNGFGDLALHVGFVLYARPGRVALDMGRGAWLPQGAHRQHEPDRERRSGPASPARDGILGFRPRAGGRPSTRVGIDLCKRPVS